uniref:Uncharacterized protein n=1 Tax=Magallana gigas TaxID=29159 RepID=K1QRL2_MAGGI
MSRLRKWPYPDTIPNSAARAAQNRVRWRTVVDGLCSPRNERPKLSTLLRTFAKITALVFITAK